MELEALISQARSGDVKAFVELTRRFQQAAYGSALTLVRDFQVAEDVVVLERYGGDRGRRARGIRLLGHGSDLHPGGVD